MSTVLAGERGSSGGTRVLARFLVAVVASSLRCAGAGVGAGMWAGTVHCRSVATLALVLPGALALQVRGVLRHVPHVCLVCRLR